VFATHNDASPTLGSEWSDLGGQRVVTAITYLNDCPTGGGTRFDRLGITVQPKRGQTLIFYPADAQSLVADDRTRHESMEAVDEKYIVQMFGRVSRVPPPLGIPDSFRDSLEKEK
jgi:prolyl 4-hydroxylase